MAPPPPPSQTHTAKNSAWETPPGTAPAAPRQCLGPEGDPSDPQTQCTSFGRLPSGMEGCWDPRAREP